MPPAPNPKNESARQAALARYQILDTPSESAFDDFTMLASQICRTPVSLISLIDGGRQWFKSRHGVEITETPRELAFCTYALESGAFLEVPDLLKDPRFSDNPLVVNGPRARFYAGAPLVTGDGFALGTLCVVDFKPRRLTLAQRKALTALSRQVMAQMEMGPRTLREKKLIEEVERKTAYQQAILSNVACAIISTDIRGNITTFNSGAEKLLGYQASEVVGKMVPTQWHEPMEVAARARELTLELGRKIEPGFEAFVAKAVAGEGETREWYFCTKDGSRVLVLLSVSAKRDKKGKLRGFIGVAHDLTRRKAAEDQRERMFNLSPDPMCLASLDGRIQRINDAFTNTLGFEKKDLEGRHFVDFVHPEDLEISIEELKKIRLDEPIYNFLNRYRCRNGDWKWISWRMQADPEEDLFYASGRDVTDIRKAAADLSASEERLRVLNENLEQKFKERSRKLLESEERYRSVMDSVNDGIVSSDSEGKIVSWNKAAERIFGYRLEDIVGQPLSLLMPERYRERHEAGLRRHLATGQSKVMGKTVELHGLHRNGKEFPLELSLSTWTTSQEQFFTGVLRDISERHEAESRLERQQELLKSLLENMSEGVVACDADGSLIYFNRTAREWHGVDALDLNSKDWAQWFGLFQGDGVTPMKEDDIPLVCAFRGEPVRNVAMVIKARGRDARFILANGNVLLGGDGRKTGAVVVMRDITELKQEERQRLRAQRMESLGNLAGGIAHDLNNALAPALLGVELLRIHYPTVPEILKSIESSMRHGAGIVRQLLTFAKGMEGERLALRPDLLVLELVSILKSTFPKNIRLRTSLGEKVPTIFGDNTQLQQVLLNLCVNARDAMPQGGTLTLELASAVIEPGRGEIDLEARPGAYVVLRVKDSGTGIPPEVLDRIFEPFFSTKAADKGTGLGLFTTAGIIRGHGGFMRVASTVGAGTTFSVYLPVKQVESNHAHPPLALKTSFRGQGETILLVDDEDSVLLVGAAVLRALNFKVITARDGTEALIQVAEFRGSVKGVITDVHMPGMDGLSFVRVLKHLLPEAVILVASGGLEEKERTEFRSLDVKVILNKPFCQEELQDGLREVFQTH